MVDGGGGCKQVRKTGIGLDFKDGRRESLYMEAWLYRIQLSLAGSTIPAAV